MFFAEGWLWILSASVFIFLSVRLTEVCVGDRKALQDPFVQITTRMVSSLGRPAILVDFYFSRISLLVYWIFYTWLIGSIASINKRGFCSFLKCLAVGKGLDCYKLLGVVSEIEVSINWVTLGQVWALAMVIVVWCWERHFALTPLSAQKQLM